MASVGSLFQAYVMVDWSAAGTPVVGVNSIWVAAVRRRRRRLERVALDNLPTRAEAVARLSDLAADLAADGRVLAGFDFPFGYPRGTARALGLGGVPWRATWAALDAAIDDRPDNANNRFDVAEAWNRRLTGEPFPFWGCADAAPRRFLSRRRHRHHGAADLPERRLCEARVRRTQPVWKLAYPGAVGSQVLVGIPRLRALRAAGAARTAIWPFETGLRDAASARVVIAEVYPSLVVPRPPPGLPKDAGQVIAVGESLAAADAAGALEGMFGADPALTAIERRHVEREEGWILGVTDRPVLADFAPGR